MSALDIVAGVMNRLVPLIENEVNLHLNSKKEAQQLALNLQKVKEVLDDAESRQLTHPSIKRWLEELQGLVYDIDDALEEWEIIKHQDQLMMQPEGSDQDVENGSSSASSQYFLEKVCPFVHSLCSCFNKVVEHRQIALDVQDLNKRVDGMYDKAEKELQLQRVIGGSGEPSRRFNIERKLENSVVVESQVHGRGHDKMKLKTMLLSRDSNDGQDEETGIGNKSMVAIVGAGGLGKTTLAKLVYNDKDLQNEFPLRIWVCVSDPFDEIRIAKEILEALEGRSPDINGFESLMRRIKEKLKVKEKFLLVLDDVWTADPRVWQPLKDYLGYGCEGSKIMITTRSRKVAEGIEATHIYELPSLTDDESWSIISRLALSRQSQSNRRLLEGVGRDIAKKCNGLPLAAQFMGNLLQDKRTVRDWQLVLHSELWELKNVENYIFGPLFLSYNELDPVVKRCFSYCAVFPKDQLIDVEQLIRMWMAQGFISSSVRGGEMELEGQDYFAELAQRSFFQDFEREKNFGEQVVRCKMHDIVHDFAQYLTKTECSIVECTDGNLNPDGNKEVVYDTCRHLWIEDPKGTLISNFDAQKLRSLICRDGATALSLLPHLKCIRALSLAGCGLKKIPDEIGLLLSLRYLDLSDNDMNELPESICNLFNLCTLDLHQCYELDTMPEEIFKLIKLRHLYVGYPLVQYPLFGLQRLVNLRRLSYFYARKQRNHLGYLKNLNKLGGELEISLFRLDEEADVDEATNAALVEKESLQALHLQYEDVGSDVLEALQPSPSLQYLRCEGPIYPSWISSITYLRKLELIGSRFSKEVEEASFPPLWKLGYLEELKIIGIRWLKCLGREFLGLTTPHVNARRDYQQVLVAFPVLQKLSFDRCRKWREWEDMSDEVAASDRIKIMPCLRQLTISDCSELEALPDSFLLRVASSLEDLNIQGNRNLEKAYDQWHAFKSRPSN